MITPTTKKEIIALVPGAGYVRDGFGRIIHRTPLFNIYHGKFAIERIIHSINKSGIRRILIGINLDDTQLLEIFQFISSKFLDLEIRIIGVVGGHQPLTRTLDVMFQTYTDLKEHRVLIYLGDTFVDLPSEDSSIWNGDFYGIAELAMADTRYQSTKNSSTKVATGVYFWNDAKNLHDNLNKILPGKENDLLALFEGLSPSEYESSEWIDYGNSAFHMNLKQMTTPSRSFNLIEVDDKRGLLVKRSTNRDKLFKEFEYFKSLPTQVQYLFPHVYEIYDDSRSATSKLLMDFFPGQSLADLWISHYGQSEVWKIIFDRLFDIVELEFGTFRHVEKTSFKDIVLENLEARLPEMAKYLPVKSAFNRGFSVNGVAIREINKLVRDAMFELEELDSVTNQIIHGDLCLSNILIEDKTFLIRLIDPRGGFKKNTIYGPKLYDIAKLCHSILGGYDLLVRDLFMISQTGNDFKLTMPQLSHQRKAQEYFLLSLTKIGVTKKQAQILSGLILISIPVFHLDSQERALSMFLRGTYQIESALSLNSIV